MQVFLSSYRPVPTLADKTLSASKFVRRHTPAGEFYVSFYLFFQYNTVKCVFYKEVLVLLTNNRTVPSSGKAL
jgi:hypothetical protein